jgi:uncharacterized protein
MVVFLTRSGSWYRPVRYTNNLSHPVAPVRINHLLHVMNKSIIALLVLLLHVLPAQSQTKIIDMHVHSYTNGYFKDRPPATDYYGKTGSANAEVHQAETFAAFRKFNIVKAMVSGNPESVENWAAQDPNTRVIRGILLYTPNDYGLDTAKFEQMVKNKEIEVFGEVGPYYSGTTLSDSIWQTYLRICEQYDIPVAVHTGGGDPGGTYTWAPKARLKLGDPYLFEDVLVKYPELRIYIMHAGEDWYVHALRLMAYYPQLYTDVALLLWVEPLVQEYAIEFLKAAKRAGYLNRVMFGSDQMVWPYAIEKSVKFLKSMKFLSRQDKEDIFYNNAARFLRLKE